MRTLKFRVWDKDNKKWWGDLSNQLIFGGTARYYNKFEPVLNYHKYDIQQFTGKLDKNNKELYEGDYIKYSIKQCDLGEAETGIGEVYYDEKFCCFLFDKSYEWDFIRSSLHFEIIGNVFENPELIENHYRKSIL